MIDITGVDLVRFAQAVYRLSMPRGMGFLHAIGGPLPEEEAKSLIQPAGRIALSMDYVRGRACKMTVLRDGERLEIRDSWYDHTDVDLRTLLAEFGKTATPAEHGISCECGDCASKRRRTLGRRHIIPTKGLRHDPQS
jgi:hypothetical protein